MKKITLTRKNQSNNYDLILTIKRLLDDNPNAILSDKIYFMDNHTDKKGNLEYFIDYGINKRYLKIRIIDNLEGKDYTLDL